MHLSRMGHWKVKGCRHLHCSGIELLLVQGPDGETAPLAKDVAKLKKSQAARSVPVVAVLNGPKESGPHPFLMELVGAGVDGIALPLESLDTAAHAFGLQNASSAPVDKQVRAGQSGALAPVIL